MVPRPHTEIRKLWGHLARRTLRRIDEDVLPLVDLPISMAFAIPIPLRIMAATSDV